LSATGQAVPAAPGGSQRVVVTVVGKDRVGIIAAVTADLADAQVNIIDISQSVKSDFFVMFAVGDMARSALPLEALKARLAATGERLGLRIDAQHEDVFQFMHRI
jgi:ACT domain-containing protein